MGWPGCSNFVCGSVAGVQLRHGEAQWIVFQLLGALTRGVARAAVCERLIELTRVLRGAANTLHVCVPLGSRRWCTCKK